MSRRRACRLIGFAAAAWVAAAVFARVPLASAAPATIEPQRAATVPETTRPAAPVRASNDDTVRRMGLGVLLAGAALAALGLTYDDPDTDETIGLGRFRRGASAGATGRVAREVAVGGLGRYARPRTGRPRSLS